MHAALSMARDMGANHCKKLVGLNSKNLRVAQIFPYGTKQYVTYMRHICSIYKIICRNICLIWYLIVTYKVTITYMSQHISINIWRTCVL